MAAIDSRRSSRPAGTTASLAALIVESEHARCCAEARGLQVAQQGVHGRRPGLCGTPYRLTDAHGADSGPAGQTLLAHGETVVDEGATPRRDFLPYATIGSAHYRQMSYVWP